MREAFIHKNGQAPTDGSRNGKKDSITDRELVSPRLLTLALGHGSLLFGARTLYHVVCSGDGSTGTRSEPERPDAQATVFSTASRGITATARTLANTAFSTMLCNSKRCEELGCERCAQACQSDAAMTTEHSSCRSESAPG